MDEAFYTIDSLAERWSVSRKTVERLIAKGDLKAVKMGRIVRIPPEYAEEYIREHGIIGQPSTGHRQIYQSKPRRAAAPAYVKGPWV